MADVVPWVNVCSQNTKADFYGFLKSLDVWIEKPHVVNRRLMGALIVRKTSSESLTSKDLERVFLDQEQVLVQDTCIGTAECEELKQAESEHESRLENIKTVKPKSDEKEHLSEPGLGECEEGHDSIILRRLLPRQLDRKDAMFELVILEKKKRRVSFFPLSPRVLYEDDCQSYHDWLNKSESYSILYEEESIPTKELDARVSLQVMDNITSNESKRDGVLCPTVQWLQDHLLPKLCKWAEEIQPDGKTSKGSLRLVPLEQYTVLYHRLKQDYGEKLVKMWPERTDPQKFVYEDIAIASYLLILWEEERKTLDLKQKQSFVDLGCGNGLLVHILSEEGHPGTGIDVRRRKIWDMYGRNTNLQERALDPTVASLFPDVDWLIGNHSDELTPWIPVMAARSLYTTRYFVLPCCLFDFNCKFVRKNNKVTQYRGYLDFVHEVGETCGFQVEEDSLRIPSTKRICQIGRIRVYPEEDHHLRDTIIREMIQRRGCGLNAGNIPETLVPVSTKQSLCHGLNGQFLEEKSPCKSFQQIDDQIHGTPAIADNGLCNRESFSTQTLMTGCYSNVCSSQVSKSTFQPRPSKEPMRNCTTLDRSLKDFIVNTVARNLLGLPLKTDEEPVIDPASEIAKLQPAFTSGTCTSSWRRGGQLELPEVAKLFNKSTLLQLKNECGGLQTLLRNHYYIFKVAGGVVQMRNWTQETPGPRGKKGDVARKQRRSQALWKTSLCWFYLQHPDGCPVAVEQCPFAHGEDELRERPTAEYLNNL